MSRFYSSLDVFALVFLMQGMSIGYQTCLLDMCIKLPYSITELSFVLSLTFFQVILLQMYFIYSLLLLNFELPGDSNFLEVCVEGCLCVLSVYNTIRSFIPTQQSVSVSCFQFLRLACGLLNSEKVTFNFDILLFYTPTLILY